MATKLPSPEYLSLEEANNNGLQIQWDPADIYQPKEKKLVVLKHIDIRDLEEYLDWNLLFEYFDLKGRYPKILKDTEQGIKANECLEKAKIAITDIKKNNEFQIDALFKVWPANSQENSVSVEHITLHFLRQQSIKKKSQPNYCLSDFVAPSALKKDYLGTYLLAVKDKLNRSDVAMVQAVKKLLVDAARKYLHLKVRTDYWAYAKREKLSTEDVLKHKYQGIIIPFGHAALPNKEAEAELAILLNATNNLGLTIADSNALGIEYGLCFSHPETKYFGTGKLGEDQLKDFQKKIGQEGQVLPEALHQLLY